jgi:CBS domain containing-hemolysin-like protein
MESWLLVDVILVVLFVGLEGFFSGSEIAIVSANRIRLRHRADQGDERAQRLLDLLEAPEQLLATTLVGTNVSVVVATTLATVALIHLFGTRGELYALVLMWPLALIFGEIMPKTIFQENADRVAPRIVKPLSWAMVCFQPIIVMVGGVARVLVARKAEHRSPFVTKEEIDTLLRGADRTVELEMDERRMIRRIFEFGNSPVKEVMVPLVEVVAMPTESSPDAVIAKINESGLSRIPVYQDEVYNIIGLINAFDLLTLRDHVTAVDGIVRPVHYVPEAKRQDDLLRELQRKKMQMAVVVDEYGGAVGIATIEDLMEEIVGEIHDEFDRSRAWYKEMPDGSYLVDARMELDHMEEELGLDLPRGDYETLGGFLVNYLEIIPRPGKVVEAAGMRLRVLEADSRSVKSVRIEGLEQEEEKARGAEEPPAE